MPPPRRNKIATRVPTRSSSPGPLRVLLVSHHHPTSQAIGAVRVNSFAVELQRLGCEVREVRGRTEPATTGSSNPTQDTLSSRRRLLRLPRTVAGWVRHHVLAIPDKATRDVPTLLRAARAHRAWEPQVILASGPPFSAYIAASKMAKRMNVPWVADYRDLWTLGSYYSLGPLRRRIDRAIEKRVLRNCVAVVTVSKPLAHQMEHAFGVTATVVLNGTDVITDDPDLPRIADEMSGGAQSSGLKIVHTGSIYPGRRDPRPLLQALAVRGHTPAPRAIFVGPRDESLTRQIHEYCLESQVDTATGAVTREESLRIQRSADILLLLMWNHPGEEGVYTGKIFDYLAARRPILMIGYPEGVAAQLIRERNAGVVATTPEEITEALTHWSVEKQARGFIKPLPSDVVDGLSRADAAAALVRVLNSVVPSQTS